MIEWDRFAVEDFLGIAADKRVGVMVEYVFDLPMPGGVVQFCVVPSEHHCQFVSPDEHARISAHMQCTRIVISDEPEEEGGHCLVLQGNACHACVRPGTPYFELFFSMHGRDTTRQGGGGSPHVAMDRAGTTVSVI